MREPDGCPWDREQTAVTMAPSLIEEAHELQEAIDDDDSEEIALEAGDVLMNVALICRIGMEAGQYDLAQAAHAVSDKLVRRHPHVFGDVNADSSDEVLQNWEAIKKAERQEKQQDDSALAGVPKALPALQRAARVCQKAVSAGFRWSSVEGAIKKVEEEFAELTEHLTDDVRASVKTPKLEPAQRDAIEAELGDLLLASAYLGQYLGVDPERACRLAIQRFERRFRALEEAADAPLKEMNESELVDLWQAAKQAAEV